LLQRIAWAARNDLLDIDPRGGERLALVWDHISKKFNSLKPETIKS
jgi:hypothetical protein